MYLPCQGGEGVRLHKDKNRGGQEKWVLDKESELWMCVVLISSSHLGRWLESNQYTWTAVCMWIWKRILNTTVPSVSGSYGDGGLSTALSPRPSPSLASCSHPRFPSVDHGSLISVCFPVISHNSSAAAAAVPGYWTCLPRRQLSPSANQHWLAALQQCPSRRAACCARVLLHFMYYVLWSGEFTVGLWSTRFNGTTTLSNQSSGKSDLVQYDDGDLIVEAVLCLISVSSVHSLISFCFIASFCYSWPLQSINYT